MFNKAEAGVRQNEPFADPLEQRGSKRCLQRSDLSRQCRLRQAELAGRSRERAGVCRGAEGACLIPIHFIHTDSYIRYPEFGNTTYFCMC